MRSGPLDVEHQEKKHLGTSGSIGAIVLHGLLALLTIGAISAPARVKNKLENLDWIEVEAPPPPAAVEPPPPPPPPPEPPKISRTDPPPSSAAPAESEPQPHEAPPSAAEAGQVLAADDVVDFGETFVVGRGSRYRGGTSDANGTSTVAVRKVDARGGGNGSAQAGAAPAKNLSHAPSLQGGASWDCPFPHEADEEGIHQAVATIEVNVSAAGKVSTVNVVQDPGNGFGRAAKRCAFNKDWSPGTNAEGSPIAATTVVRVRFQR